MGNKPIPLLFLVRVLPFKTSSASDDNCDSKVLSTKNVEHTIAEHFPKTI